MKPSVLAIDDSRTIRELLRQPIESAGFIYFTAEDGVEGIERFQQLTPDVVITDINMPRKDGYGVIKDIRNGAENTFVPILVLTTESSDEAKARARDAGATGWIVKPFNDASLISVLQRVTGGP